MTICFFKICVVIFMVLVLNCILVVWSIEYLSLDTTRISEAASARTKIVREAKPSAYLVNTFAEISSTKRGGASGYYDEKNSQEPAQQMDNFSLSGINQKGRKNWDISGKSADISSDVIRLNDIVSNFYGENENTTLTAARGDFDRKLGQLHLEKDVVVTTSSGAKMTTDTLVWDRREQVVSTKDVVNIERQGMIVTAEGAKGYSDLKKVALEKDVQMQIRTQQTNPPGLADTNTIVITCDGPLQIDYQDNIATFNNKVKVESRDGIIESDIMEVYFLTRDKEQVGKTTDTFSFGGAEIEKIIARGNVRISRDKNISYSQEAVYFASDRKITLSGQPKLVIYSNEIE